MAAPDYVYDLLASESLARWNASSPLGTPVTITYRFPAAQPSSGGYSNFTAFTETEIAATRKALAYISSLTNITFVETSDANAELQFGNADLTPYGSGVSGRATYSYNSSGITEALVVLSNTGQASLAGSDFVPGSISSNDIGGNGWQTLLHEIGHALGLKHPFEQNIAGDPNSVMPADRDNLVKTVMSYTAFQPSNVAIVTGNESSYTYTASNLKPQTYGIFDIAALQYLYGAQTAASSKTYVLTPTSPVFETIHDRGTGSTIDLSAFSQGCTVDMEPGAVNALPIRQSLPFAINLQNPYDGTAALTFAYGSLVGGCIGGSGNDRIAGNAGANRLDGGAGADTLTGRGGHDIYSVDNADDRVIEAASQGSDVVYASVSYTLAAGQDIESLQAASATATTALTLTGNERPQNLKGNAGANRLDGGGGADLMVGRGGNDTYIVDNAGDRVVEATGAGNDVVGALTSYTLTAGQEIETLRLALSTTTQNLDLTGNTLDQAIIGNSGKNTLSGGGGTDTMTGGKGDDTYLADSLDDRVFEAAGEGSDRVFASSTYYLASGQEIEALQLLSSTGTAKFNIAGNEFRQTLVGNNGANALDGKAGLDVLTGRGGADLFVFSTALGSGNVDRITDFASEDTIRLSKSVFAALAPGQLDSSAFKNISTGAADGNDRILYKQATGELFYDADGSSSGAAVKFAVLDNKAALTNADFLVV